MNCIPAQEIKRRGIAAVDEVIEAGDVHVIRNNRPQYVVMTEERYQSLIADAGEAYQARIKEALRDVAEGRITKGSAADLLKELGIDD